MNLNNYLIIIGLFFLVVSCGDDLLTPEEEATQAELNYSGPRILMDMSEDLVLTISVDNFSEAVENIQFDIVYDHTKFSVSSSSIQNGDFPGALDNNLNYSPDATIIEIIKSGNIEGDGILVTINFSGSNYDDTVISLIDFLILKSDGLAQYITCDNPDINSQTLCTDNGNKWGPTEVSSGQHFYSQNICYIDEGWLISSALNLPGPLSETWEPTDNYVWSNSFCY